MNLKIHLQFNYGAVIEIAVRPENFSFEVGDLTFLLSTIKEILVKLMP